MPIFIPPGWRDRGIPSVAIPVRGYFPERRDVTDTTGHTGVGRFCPNPACGFSAEIHGIVVCSSIPVAMAKYWGRK